MWQQKINVALVRISYPAWSLVEILISTALAAVLLLSLSTSYTDFYLTQMKQKEQLYLQAEVHQLLHYFQRHFQHIGYQGEQRKDSNFDLFQLNGRSVNIPHTNCLISFYDINQDGCLGNRRTKTTACKLGELNQTKDILKEVFGFKLENKEIYYFSTNLDNCIKAECQKLLNGCDGTWSKLTSVHHFKVNKLAFIWKQENTLLQIELEIESSKDSREIYAAKSYVFILNH
ncbi:hypothetical protein A6B39_08980 [Mannheimia granulomatis]|uniref:hypothetical protein n=1 Tax=Mannheimia granulomatis TaxID=85402 RepID=UPI001F28CBCB|nr:hypothetical protein [Mannheimia granulomatis]QLB15577.1 hypothetical protein A6B39_08980 [Mannheimia granulomatis]